MNSQLVHRLEALLERVQRNAAQPRPARKAPVNGAGSAEAAGHLVAVAPAPAEQLAEEKILLEAAPAAREQRPEPAVPEMDLAPIEEAASVDEGELLDLDAPEEAATPSEPAPESSRRVAASMDEALAGVAERQEAPKTIPPESGPEPLTGVEAEFGQGRTETEFGHGVQQGPTTEQLGQTIQLEEGPRAEFELDEPLAEPIEEVTAETSTLEAELPSGAGIYDQELTPPPDAREELERVRLGEVRAQVVARPVISTNVVEFLQAQERPAAESFVGWVDASLGLGGD